MKIAFCTSTFNDRPIEETLDFARDAGFDAIEIDIGSHINTPDRVRAVLRAAADWRKFLAHAKASGFNGVVSVEHEDADFGWPRLDLALRKRGEEEALHHLRNVLLLSVFGGREKRLREQDFRGDPKRGSKSLKLLGPDPKLALDRRSPVFRGRRPRVARAATPR